MTHTESFSDTFQSKSVTPNINTMVDVAQWLGSRNSNPKTPANYLHLLYCPTVSKVHAWLFIFPKSTELGHGQQDL